MAFGVVVIVCCAVVLAVFAAVVVVIGVVIVILAQALDGALAVSRWSCVMLVEVLIVTGCRVKELAVIVLWVVVVVVVVGVAFPTRALAEVLAPPSVPPKSRSWPR